MKLKNFKEKNKKKKAIFIGSVFVVLLISTIVLIRSFALFETKQEYNVISGVVPESSDITLSFVLEENGSKKVLSTMPEGKDYSVTIDCNRNATGSWDYESWGPVIGNLSESLTRCKIIFSPAKILENVIKENVVTSGLGVYEVNHSEAVIGTHMNATQTNNLKQTEYRYAGVDPNNYIKFNNELWRIIGLVNTPEGSRVKLIRNESIGNYSWDTSETLVNNGYGVNEWSGADLMKLLNSGYESESVGGSLYWNKKSGNCYKGINNATVSCDFTINGLNSESKSKIDSITWNLGTNGTNNYISNTNGLTKHFYNYERSNSTGKICSSGMTCNDIVHRTTIWNGKVGIISASDYGYATSGGSKTNRESCLNKELYGWNDSELNDCKDNDWIYSSKDYQWLINPFANISYAYFGLGIYNYGIIGDSSAIQSFAVRPSIYLISELKILEGNGSISKPYILL